VDPATEHALAAAEEAVRCLIEHCRRGGRLYNCAPRAVAQISRTGKWHLAAIDALRKALDAQDDEDGKQGA
jgi:hypothetical protein